MILIALGSNLAGPDGSSPRANCEAALDALAARGVTVAALSRWYETDPVPVSDQPLFSNAVARVRTSLSPGDLMRVLHGVEESLGRVRSVPNAARVIDLDLLDWDGVVAPADAWPVLPHPRLVERAFVLLPLRDVAPRWCHPESGECVEGLIAALGPLDGIRVC